MVTDAPLTLDAVSVRYDDRLALDAVDWTVRSGDRWVVVGANGSGKTTLLRILAGWSRPSSGRAVVLGEELGRTDLRTLRTRIGFTSQALVDQLRPNVTPHDVVLAGRHAALESWWHDYDPADHAEARDRLAAFGVGEAMAARAMRTLSSGERQRVMLARAFTGDPGLVILDEPTAGLDVGGREDLVTRLDAVVQTSEAPVVLVTHHLEEIPSSFTHALLLDHGIVAGAGPVEEHLTSGALSAIYGMDLTVEHVDGRWTARALSPRPGP